MDPSIQASIQKIKSFHRWTRKPWAIFSSLGSIIKISVLSLTISLVSHDGFSQSETDSTRKVHVDKEVNLDEIVVTAQKSPVLQSELLRMVSVIPQVKIDQAQTPGVSGILEHTPGVDIRQRGAFGMQSDISIRGGTFDQTLILLNGVNITDPQTGHHNLNLPVDPLSIERIEVLRGPAARIFGPNAFNGAINIITNNGPEHELKATLAGGQYGYWMGSLSYSVPYKNFNYHIGVNAITSSGYNENTDFTNINFFQRALFPINKLNFDLQAGYTSRAFGANAFYTPRFPEQYEKTGSTFASITVSPESRLKLKGQVYYRQHNDRFELFRHEAPAWYAGHNYHMTDVAGASVNWSLSGTKSRTNIGADYRYEQIYSTVLGDTIKELKPVPSEDSVMFNHFYKRNTFSIMAEHSAKYGRLSFSAGLLLNANTALKNGVSVYPGIDVGFALTPKINWFGSVNRTLRLPTFTDLFYNSPTNLGNRDLKPEEAFSYESGLKYFKKDFNFEVAVFKRNGRNMIDWVRFSDDEKWKSMNITKVNISGIELTTAYIPDSKQRSFIRSASLGYTYMAANKKSEGFTSLYVLDILKHKLDLSLTHRITKKSGMEWSLSLQDRNGGYQPYVDGKWLPEVPYQTALFMDLRSWYDYRFMRFFVDVTNLLNTKIMDHANVEQPGFWAIAGVKLKIKE